MHGISVMIQNQAKKDIYWITRVWVTNIGAPKHRMHISTDKKRETGKVISLTAQEF